MRGVRNLARQLALIQSHRNKEEVVLRKAGSHFESEGEFTLKLPTLRNRIFRKTAEKEIGDFDGLFNRPRPFLTGQKLLAVHPRLKTGPLQLPEQLPDSRAILLCVRQENDGVAGRFEYDLMIAVVLKRTHALDFDGSSFAKTAVNELQKGFFGRLCRH
jgi:hypothetical protein